MLALHRTNPSRYPFLLESVARTSQHTHSLLFAFPQKQLSLKQLSEESFGNRLDNLFKQQQTHQAVTHGSHLPFRGGWFLYLSYELAGQLEPTLHLPATQETLPLALAVRVPAAIIIKHDTQQTYLLAEDDFQEEFRQLQADVAAMPLGVNNDTLAKLPSITVCLQEEEPSPFLRGVERIREYIQAGDVFQVNLSRAWRGTLPPNLTAADLYQRLRHSNPAPLAGLAQFDDFAIISSSPERLVRVHNQGIETRPIAGTRPRGHDNQQDQALLTELLAHPKERAEHIMLIDLERNDLGRLCEYGSVKVDELMTVESYPHVHHIVSNITGKLKPSMTPGQIIRAVFPGGTITGCPKVRCMEIIAELEQTGRGAYTGSLGYLNHNGDMDLNILIRSMTLHQQQLVLRTGAGIVMDSVPEHELAETRHKARGLLRALQHAID